MSRVRRGFGLALVAVTLAGCSLWSSIWSPPRRAGGDLFERADALAERHDYEGALAAYDEIVARDPQGARRARLFRDVVGTVVRLRADLAEREAELLTLRQSLVAREAELARQQREVAGREAELGRLRAEITTRQAEIARLTTESDQLRSDLDQLKRLDLLLEQRRR